MFKPFSDTADREIAVEMTRNAASRIVFKDLKRISQMTVDENIVLLVNLMNQRFLPIHVFVMRQRGQHDGSMTVIRRRNNYRIEFIDMVGKSDSVILGGKCVGAGGGCLGQCLRVDIA